MEIMNCEIYYTSDNNLGNFIDACIYHNMLNYRLSELAAPIASNETGYWNQAVSRAIRVCKTASLPTENNFKNVYMVGENGIIVDWILSSLALRLVLLNADPMNAAAAKLQMEILKKLEE